MNLFSHSTGENRLLGYSLEDINKQRLAAGATKTVTPYNARTAEANAAMQNMTTQSTGTAITDPASASLQRLRQTQEYLTQNPTVDPTGSINTQALAGQKLAESYVAPRNLGNEQYYADQGKFLGDATRTYSNASEGFASEVAQTINNDPNSPAYGQRIQGGVDVASMSAIQQSAIDRLRSEGKTDEQIKTIMNDPVYMENIRTTMSNTGQGGTARQSAVLTPAQAQTILATSRNALERSKAQQFLDAEAEKGVSRTIQVQVGTDKTGQPIYQTRTNPNFEKELEAKKQRMTQEQTNALKVQESMSKMKDFTSGIDTSAFEMTKNQITEAMGMIKNLSPDLQSAVLPTLLSLQESNNRNNESALQMKSTLPTDKEIEAQYGSFEAYITKMDEKMKTMNEENKQLQLDVAKYNRDALEIDKQIIEHDAYVAEQKQMQANIENEKRLRRQLGKLGITTDVQGLDFLQNEIQKGADAYNDLKKGNNLVSLKAQLAIGQGYALDVRKAISDYDAKDLQITSQTAEALMKVKQSISTAKSDRDKELRSILKDANDKKDENAKEARTTIQTANFRMLDDLSKKKTLDAQKEKDALAQIEYLSKNFDPSVVADQIKQLAKNVTSFDASTLAGQSPISLQLALKKLGKGTTSGGGGFSYSSNGTAQVTATTPLVSLGQFFDQKISEKENELGMSMTPTARKDYLDKNKANLMSEYNAMKSATSTTVVSSGNQAVDEAARLIYEGIIPNVSEASKKLGVPYGAVAQQVSKLRQNGVGDNYVPMTDKQQAAFLKLSKSLDTDPVVQYARAVPNKVANINTALNNRTGVGDLAAINSFQNGLVDPGVSVRSDDINLIVNEAAPILAKYSTSYWQDRLKKGAVLPDAEREQIRTLANQLQENIVKVYQNTSYQRTLQTGRALGIPEKNLQVFKSVDYSNPDIPTIQPEQEEANSGTDTELDSLLSSHGY